MPTQPIQTNATTAIAQNAGAPSTLVVLQPGYLPWIGFFDQMQRADVFVIYDDVQYDKNGWRNRNRIKSPQGAHWVTVPVKVSLGQRIMDVEIDNRQPWARKHLETIKQFYKKSLYFDKYFPGLEEILNRGWESIAELDVALIEQLHDWLGFKCEVARSSQLAVPGDRNERLLHLSQKFGVNRYLSGNSAQCYLDVDLFARNNIQVEWQNYTAPTYSQLHGEFVPYLSIVDLLFNCGPESPQIIAAGSSEQ